MTPRRRWFAVWTELLREPWPHELKATLVLLGLHMIDRWAVERLSERQATKCRLSPGDLLNITGRQSVQEGISLLQQLAAEITLRVTPLGNGFTVVEWPKFAENLKVRRPVNKRQPGRNGPAYGPPIAPSSTSTSEEEEETSLSRTRTEEAPASMGHVGVISGAEESRQQEAQNLEAYVADIRERIWDRGNPAVIRRLAAQLPSGLIEEAIEQSRARFRDGLTRAPAAYFVGVCRQMAQERGIRLIEPVIRGRRRA